MRKHWLGITMLPFLALALVFVWVGVRPLSNWPAMIFDILLLVWIVRGFFRFIGRAIGHGMKQSTK